MMQIECCSVWVGPNMDLKVNCNLRWFLCTNTFEEYAYSLLLKNRLVGWLLPTFHTSMESTQYKLHLVLT
jgi:hypothetical protein